MFGRSIFAMVAAPALGLAAVAAIPTVAHAKPGDCTNYVWPSNVVINTDGWVLRGGGQDKSSQHFSIEAVPAHLAPIFSPGMFLDGGLKLDGTRVSGSLSLHGSSDTAWNFDGGLNSGGYVSGQANGKPFSMDNPLICTAKEAAPAAPPPPVVNPPNVPPPVDNTPKASTATVNADTDLFDKPNDDGDAVVIDVLTAGRVVTVVSPCSPDAWCILSDPKGAAWGRDLTNN